MSWSITVTVWFISIHENRKVISKCFSPFILGTALPVSTGSEWEGEDGKFWTSVLIPR